MGFFSPLRKGKCCPIFRGAFSREWPRVIGAFPLVIKGKCCPIFRGAPGERLEAAFSPLRKGKCCPFFSGTPWGVGYVVMRRLRHPGRTLGKACVRECVRECVRTASPRRIAAPHRRTASRRVRVGAVARWTTPSVMGPGCSGLSRPSRILAFREREGPAGGST